MLKTSSSLWQASNAGDIVDQLAFTMICFVFLLLRSFVLLWMIPHNNGVVRTAESSSHRLHGRRSKYSLSSNAERARRYLDRTAR